MHAPQALAVLALVCCLAIPPAHADTTAQTLWSAREPAPAASHMLPSHMSASVLLRQQHALTGRTSPVNDELVLAQLASAANDTPQNHLTLSRSFTSLLERVGDQTSAAVARAQDFLGIRYRRGGQTPETGFDCSGLVGYVFQSLGTQLPRTAREMSREGTRINKDELQPGDLVFFNTMRRAFSHVGIYMGNNQFLHAPASGGAVRIDDMRENYWFKRYNGARRIASY